MTVDIKEIAKLEKVSADIKAVNLNEQRYSVELKLTESEIDAVINFLKTL